MIGILKYNAGNITSVKNALDRLNINSVISSDPRILERTERLIIPGVGEAGSAMNYLKKHALDSFILNYERPVLGICLGLQILCMGSEESNTECLGVFDTNVRAFPKNQKVTHMGWNNMICSENDLLNGVDDSMDFYYVHSYFAENCIHTIALCNYGESFSAVLHKQNYYACQFHPEKSGTAGAQFLKNFIKL